MAVKSGESSLAGLGSFTLVSFSSFSMVGDINIGGWNRGRMVELN